MITDGQSFSPPPSPFSAVKEKQLLRNANNLLLEDENNQKLDDLTERLSSLGGENTTASARATSALRNSTRHNAQAKKEGPRVSKLKKRKRDQPAGKTWWLNCLILLSLLLSLTISLFLTSTTYK